MRRGVTLLEILIVIGILVVVTTLLIAAFGSFKKQKPLDGGVALLVAMLTDARSRTLASQNDSVWGVHIEVNRFVLFRGSVYTSGAADNEAASLPPEVEVSATSLSGGGSDVVFARLTGTTSKSGSVTLILTNASTTEVVIIAPSGVASHP